LKGLRPLLSVSSQIYGHLCVWKSPLNSKLIGNTDLFTLDMGSFKKNTPFPFTFPKRCSLSFYIILLLITACYYYMLVLTKYHWNIYFQNKMPSKYVLKNTRSVTHFVWQTFFHWISRFCQMKNNKYIH
jgi:hypothetical protein